MQLRRGQRLLAATHNGGKLRELNGLLAPFGLDLVSADELGLPEPDETGESFEANARIKALAAARASGEYALADDSGVVVEALDGAPGIFTARWAGPEHDFGKAMVKTHMALMEKGVVAPDARKAEFVAVLCLASPEGATECFEGRAPGILVWPPRGNKGFGYDPMFQPDRHLRTFGEMSEAEKHSWAPGKPGLSHRARAFANFVEACCER
ncbi:MAG: non-canonical purine NTP pyrophosphatase [Cucumibacter sp.]